MSSALETQPLAVRFVDHSDRARIHEDLEATLVVEAGAGTGKTTALVGRILALVSSGRTDLHGIAAITFTEAAAAELRERLHRELRSSPDPRLRESADELEEAAITTIHGFAQRLLAEHPLEAGLPLRFRVLDEIATSLDAERRFTDFISRIFDEPMSRSLVAASVLLGVRTNELRHLARSFEELFEHRELSPSITDDLDMRLAREVDAASAAAHRSLVEAIAKKNGCADPEDALFERLSGLEEELARFARSPEWLDRLSWLVELRAQRPGHLGRQPAWRKEDLAEARAALASFDCVRREGIASVSDVVLRALGARLHDEARANALQRKEAGELSFHDLLVHARDLLANHERVRRELQERYAYLLVDEFQDTDPLQLEIVRLLGTEPGANELSPGKCFFVGDPKQSIYRFRRADVELYEETVRELSGEDRIRLRTNFRSDPAILEWVNGVFTNLFGSGSFMPLSPARPPEQASVRLLGGPAEAPLPARARRELESREIASTIRSAIDEGWLVHVDGEIRSARESDVAILVPRRSGLTELEGALEEAGIAYAVESSSLIYRSVEVRDLLSCLHAIDRPGDEVAIIAALRTPAFGCGDDDLLSWRAAGGEWRIDALTPAGLMPAHPVALGLETLASYSASARRIGVAELVASFVEERKLRQIAAGLHNAREAHRRLSYLIEETRAFAESGGRSLTELLAWMSLQSELGTRSIEPIHLAGEQAVRILTVHGAKGLEFPIVVLAELGGSARSGPRNPTVLRSKSGGLEIYVNSRRTTDEYSVLAAEELDKERAEALRLAYVAATRARDHLIVSLHHVPAASETARTLAERIFEAAVPLGAPRAPTSEEASGVPDPLGRSAPMLQRPAWGGPGATAEGTEAWWERHRAVALLSDTARHIAATDLVDALPKRRLSTRAIRARADHGEGVDPISGSSRRGASRLGRAVHATLESVDLATGVDLETRARAAADAEGCPERVSRVAELAAAAIASPVVATAASSPGLWRELPIAVEVEGKVLEGVIDLCYRSESGLVVVDYKTDALGSASEAAAAAARYRPQAGAYMLALEMALGMAVERFVFLFLALPTSAIEHDLTDLAGAVAEARNRLVESANPVMI